MNIQNFTSIGRTIDPKYPTNRAILALSMAVTLAGGIFQFAQGRDLLQSGLWGIQTGLSVFLTWVLARELDPDHENSAFLAAGLGLTTVLRSVSPNLTAALWLVLILRIINRTVGPPAKLTDSLGIVAFSLWLSVTDKWIYGLVSTLGFALDGLLEKQHRRHLGFALITLIVAVVSFIMAEGIPEQAKWSLRDSLWVYITIPLFLLVIYRSRKLSTRCDIDAEPLIPPRVQAGQFIALLTLLLLARWEGPTSLAALQPIWASLLGVSLYQIAMVFSQFLPKFGSK